jgi:hypothetical protein
LEAGQFYVVHTNIRGEFWLRVALMNPLTEVEDFTLLIQSIRRIAYSLLSTKSYEPFLDPQSH